MIIFLDIDGVMAPATSWKRAELLSDGFAAFNSKAVLNLMRIVSATGATLVLTTSHKSNYTLKEWKAIFEDRGINVPIEKLDDNLGNLSRKDEILNWLGKSCGDSFVIIDDDKSLNALPDSVKDKLVLTSPLVGLTEDNAISAIDILESQESVWYLKIR